MKLRFLIPLLMLVLGCSFGQQPIGVSRVWTSHSGTKLNGVLMGSAEGKVVLKSARGNTVTVATNQFSEGDVRYLRSAVFDELAEHIRQNPGKTDPNWPDVLFVDPADFKIAQAAKEGKWHVWTSKHWKIHTERDLPE